VALGADVSKATDVDRMVQSAIAELGRVDVLVNNAGIRLITPLLDISEEEWDRHLDVDLKGPFLCLQAVAKQMLRQGSGGVIINITSTASEEGAPGRAHYCAAKGGLKMLTKVAALELAQYGIRVNAIAPGPIETAMTAMLRETPEQAAAGARRMPLGRWGQSDDLVGAALFLASEEASWVTGINLWIDGGALAGRTGELPSKVAADILAARSSGT
jgi:NAD(P)-dependent dehydrogenase (short-subunit alcohol dehydrogenase family)